MDHYFRFGRSQRPSRIRIVRPCATGNGHVTGDGFAAEVTADEGLGDDAELIASSPDNVKLRPGKECYMHIINSI